MIDSQRFTKILGFLETIDQLKLIYRSAYLSDNSRHESDAEHTWHTSLFALLLYQEMEIDVDIERVLKLILIHDLVEIYAGDTFAYDTVGNYNQNAREETAASQLFALLPEDLQKLVYGWWKEFELAPTPEAQFARAMDKLQAFAQNVSSSGRVWQEHFVTEEMSRSRNKKAMAFDPALAEVFEALYQRAIRENLWDSKGSVLVTDE